MQSSPSAEATGVRWNYRPRRRKTLKSVPALQAECRGADRRLEQWAFHENFGALSSHHRIVASWYRCSAAHRIAFQTLSLIASLLTEMARRIAAIAQVMRGGQRTVVAGGW
ncbi:hypothetical protein HYFRA_00004391 [Hymenoscyphus fraxineus]|uniref:Uncharacterized protein n=1 Tax=Hymenoscyphus fraxineus TaxID=746836 RepID=A0A9N9KV66_9HELO|nr:hypothetical protein HYFRA_00004391 [Hymenoscyphus fraxineus]